MHNIIISVSPADASAFQGVNGKFGTLPLPGKGGDQKCCRQVRAGVSEEFGSGAGQVSGDTDGHEPGRREPSVLHIQV